jgi:UDP-glucose-4-epimerase GalE
MQYFAGFYIRSYLGSVIMKTALVLGGAGYIGSHMVNLLARKGWQVTVFDNLSRGHQDSCPSAEFIVGDLTRFDEIDACLSKKSFDVIMHFAACAYVAESVRDPELYYQNNVIGSLNLLRAMRKQHHSRLIFSSSCATYGVPTCIPMAEDTHQEPISPYGFTKLVIEHALIDYALAYDINSVSLRYFNAAGCDASGVIGERHDPETHLIPLALYEALRTKNGAMPNGTLLNVFGDDFATPDGSCIRDYVHVTDLCQGHFLAAEKLISGHVKGAQFFNLANKIPYSVFEVIDACRRVTGQPIHFKIQPRRPGDAPALTGNARKAFKELGWEPTYISLDAIISTAWNYMLTTDVRQSNHPLH